MDCWAEAKGMARTEFIGNLIGLVPLPLRRVCRFCCVLPEYSGLTVVGSSDPAGAKKAIFKKQIHSTNCLGFSLMGTPFIRPASRDLPICHSLGGLVMESASGRAFCRRNVGHAAGFGRGKSPEKW